MIRTSLMLTTILGASLLVGCGGDDADGTPDAGTQADGGGGGDAGGGGALVVSGPIEGTLPAGAQAAVVWYLEDGNAFKQGEATVTGSTFSADLGTAPPAEGLFTGPNGEKFGVAWVVVFPEAQPDGAIAPATFGTMIGQTARHGVVYRQGPDFTNEGWPMSFPDGEMACGSCVDDPSNNDSYELASCSSLVLYVGAAPAEGACNIF